MRNVAIKRKLPLVIDKFVMLIGGIDITQDVIDELKCMK